MDDQTNWHKLRESLRLAADTKYFDRDVVITAMQDSEPADIALTLEELEPEAAEKVFAMLENQRAADVLRLLGSELARRIVGSVGEEKLRLLTEPSPKRAAAVLRTAPVQKRPLLQQG